MTKQRRFLSWATAIGIAITAAPFVQAGSATFNFSTDPTGILDLIGDALWVSDGGNPGGYLEITPAQTGRRGTIIFDDFDNGLVVKAFTFSCDLKIGDGTASPADGFSLNYVRENDPALTSHDGNGWATGPQNEANLPEEGTQTGLAIGFDAWQSGDTAAAHGLPDGDVRYDCIGISVRVDNQLVFQKPMRTLNGAATDAASLQTGPRLNGDGTNPALTWQPLKVELTEDGKINLWWKNSQILTNLQTAYFPSRGRLIFTGRTGDAYQLQAIDNIQITTVPAAKPSIAGVTLNALNLTVKLADAGAVTVNTNTIVTKLNGQTLTAVSITKAAEVTTALYAFDTLLPPGATNTVQVTFNDSTGQANQASRDVTVADYVAVPATFAVSSLAIDKTKPGFRIRPYGTEATQPNTIAWTEDQLAGLHGPNMADLTGVDADGFLTATGIINYAIASDGQIGNFRDTTGYPEQPLPGFPGTQTLDGGTGNASLEILTFVEFPKAGLYTMGVNSDDGFKVSTGRDGRDKVSAVVLGYFDAGRGSADTLFSMYIPQAGIYPMRLIWENGGGGANVEWFSQLDDGTKIPINASTNGALKAYRVSSPSAIYASRATPAPGATGVAADASIEVDLTDGVSNPLDAASVKVSLNGQSLSVTTSKSGKVTTAKAALAGLYVANSTNTVVLTYADTSAVGGSATNAWSFVVAQYVTLTTDMVTTVGSGDSTKPGFRVKMYQIDPVGSNGSPNVNDFTDQELAGLFGPNTAALSGAGADGYFTIAGTINWNYQALGVGAEIGNFQGPTYPDQPIPGIPGTAAAEGGNDNIAAEILTYVEFPTAGYYKMGVNSDDGFKVTLGEAPTRLAGVQVTAPASIAKYYGALSGGSDMPWNPGISLPLPRNGVISGKVVYAKPAIADTDLTNAAEIKGNIALIDRGTVTFTQKINAAQKAGAIAVIIVNNRDAANAEGILPIGMSGVPVDPPGIPAVMMTMPDGDILKAHLSEVVTVSLGADASLRLGEFNGGRGSADTIFGFMVPTAGVYPLRCSYEQGGGGANCEWFTVTADGTKILLNDRTNAKALKAYRARTATPVQQPKLSYAVSGANLVLTFSGKLQSADTVNGTFTDMANASSPATIPMTAQAKFYRAAQ